MSWLSQRFMSENRKRQDAVRVRCTEEERALIEEKAEASGLSLAGYLRKCALQQNTPRTKSRKPVERAELERTITRTRKLGAFLKEHLTRTSELTEEGKRLLEDHSELDNF